MKENKLEFNVLTYIEMLQDLEEENSHLLLGNGFNYGLGINTGYKAIFEEMIKQRNSLYGSVLPLFEECNMDLEIFIGRLLENVNDDFLKKFFSNKIKLDFMEATQSIVKNSVKNVYAEKNEGVYILLKAFQNYFTLNYDSFLYILLLHFKCNDINNTIGFTPTIKFVEDALNQEAENIYKEIKELRKNGKCGIYANDTTSDLDSTTFSMKSETKSNFVTWAKSYSKNSNKSWKEKDIRRVVDYIFEKEKEIAVLEKVDDGFTVLKLFDDKEFIFDKYNEEQNLFFLHGAFHIYKDGEVHKKITQQSEQALYNRLEEVINNEKKDIITIFQASNKHENILNNEYLNYCIEKLKTLSGNIVLLGCALSENDSHIFESIDKSKVSTVYISTFEEVDKTYEKAKQFFPLKNIKLFDAKTISYEK